jgi:WhiB family transcriptional regulator, redox-sensing transcriptional regulator
VDITGDHSAMSKGETRQRQRSGTWEWQLLARCRGADPSMFFHGDGERGLSRQRRERKAKQFCAPCPVRIQCLLYSLRFHEPYGVWGGVAERERHRMLADANASAAGDREQPDDQARQQDSDEAGSPVKVPR